MERLGSPRSLCSTKFWFCRNPGLALPIIALQYHEVVVNWTLPDINEISINGTDASKIFQDFSDHSNDSLITNPRFNNVKLLVDYVYLDTDERRRFAQVSHEYLIEQLQFQEIPSESTIPLHFNHPVKELIWTAVPVCSPFFDFGGEPTPQQGYMGSVTETTIANDRQKLGGTFFSKLTTQSKLDGSIGNMRHQDSSNNNNLGPGFFNTTSSSEVFNITLKLNGQRKIFTAGY